MLPYVRVVKVLQRWWRAAAARMAVGRRRTQLTLARVGRGYIARLGAGRRWSPLVVRLQRWWRRVLARAEAAASLERNSARLLQRVGRGLLTRRWKVHPSIPKAIPWCLSRLTGFADKKEYFKFVVTEKTQTRAEVSDRRQIGTLLKWQAAYPWARVSRHGIGCATCDDEIVIAAKSLQWATKTLKAHVHVADRPAAAKAQKAQKAEKAKPAGAVDISEALRKMSVQKSHEFAKVVQIVYKLAKAGVGVVSHTSNLTGFFARICEDQGLLAFIGESMGTTYLSDSSVREILLCIARQLEIELVEDIGKGPYGVTADGSNTRRAPRQVLTVRYVRPEGGTIRQAFLDIMPANDHTGVGLATLAEDSLAMLPKEGFASLSLDGASANTGAQRGSERILRGRLNGSCLFRWCFCHELQLCASDARKSSDGVKEWQVVMQDLFVAFNSSSVRASVLKHHDALEALCDTCTTGTTLLTFSLGITHSVWLYTRTHPTVRHRIVEAGVTRWFALLKTAAAVMERYPVVVATLRALPETVPDYAATSQRLLARLTDPAFFGLCCALLDWLEQFNTSTVVMRGGLRPCWTLWRSWSTCAGHVQCGSATCRTARAATATGMSYSNSTSLGRRWPPAWWRPCTQMW